MDTLIMVSIMTLVLFASSAPARTATLIVSNQMQKRANVPVFVTCQGSASTMYKSVPLGQLLMIEITPTSEPSATDDITPTAGKNDKQAGFRVSQEMNCVGTFYRESRSLPDQPWYRLNSSNRESVVCKDVCVVVAKDNGFYRWNDEKNAWDTIPMDRFF
ncbi:hypothetical protein Bca4012_011482 [Brassica carinata]|uniref:S-protein homolog n=1 Tax=Brassica carinata TaxID=52824 RepID=A0A8X7S5W3_BRACI|nr:hypothetical protein Bca52824_036385 [Brassica carinata]KAG2299915.1 hypothetical protein Bca52824_036387 [Brassica carinata]KAG2299916.1 hypothetical protein Bca52824_036388 [Brassica carinata]